MEEVNIELSFLRLPFYFDGKHHLNLHNHCLYSTYDYVLHYTQRLLDF